jgi:hypothetical protein
MNIKRALFKVAQKSKMGSFVKIRNPRNRKLTVEAINIRSLIVLFFVIM